MTIAFFLIGFLLALTATYPTLEERIDEESLIGGEEKRIEAELPRPYGEQDPSSFGRFPSPMERPVGLINASLELRPKMENTSATISLLRDGGILIESWELERGEKKNIDLTEYHEAESILIETTEGGLTYTYTVRHYALTYSYLSIPAFVLMWISLIFLIRAIALIGPLSVDEDDRNELREDQSVIDRMLDDRKKENK